MPGLPAQPDSGMTHPRLEFLDGPIAVIGDEVGQLSGARVVARAGGFDLLVNRDGAPAVFARRGLVQPTPPFVVWQGPASDLMPGVVSGTVAAANGDDLAICHHQYNGDASSFSAFAGAYSRIRGPNTLFDGSSCQSLAFRGDRGLLALHKRAPDGHCCSRPVLFDLDHQGGVVSRQETLALPDGEFGDIRMSTYAGGFAWAGFLTRNQPAMHVRFRSDTGTVGHDLPAELTPTSDRPDIAGWPFDRAAALTWPAGNGMKLVVVRDSGELLLEDEIAAAPGEHVQRAPVETSPHGLVVTYARCPADFSTADGQLVTELRRPAEAIQSVSVPVRCHAAAQSLAVVGDIILVLFWTGEDIQGVVLRIANR
jgi:hypothetical protein